MRLFILKAALGLVALTATGHVKVAYSTHTDPCGSFRDWTEMDPLSPDDEWHTGNISFSPETQFPDGEWRDEGLVGATGEDHNSFDPGHTLSAHGHSQLCGS
jgi:hypothetical protein